MKIPDLHREWGEKELSVSDFLKTYNKNLPAQFPSASLPSLREFKRANPQLFKNNKDVWSLDRHRKRFMDSRPQRTRSTPSIPT